MPVEQVNTSRNGPVESPRILFYAMGGGLGHFVRSLAVARQLARAQVATRILFNSPFADAAEEILRAETDSPFQPELHPLPPTNAKADLSESIKREIARFIPQVLVVDTFPRGLGGELATWLPDLKVKKVLISRCLPPRYIKEKNLNEFVNEVYDLVIWPGEIGAICPTTVSQFKPIDFPFLIRDYDELPDRLTAASRLGVDGKKPTVLFSGSGTFEECEETVRQAQDFQALVTEKLGASAPQVRLVVPSAIAPQNRSGIRALINRPLLEYFPAVDLVVGSAGYNLYWETRSLGIHSHLVAQTRVYDNQTQRRSTDATQLNAAQVLQFYQQHVSVGDSSIQRSQKKYQNGAQLAAEAILVQLATPPDSL